MKKLFVLFTISALTFAGLADAGPFRGRRIFPLLRGSGGCASGQCEPGKAACPECPECPNGVCEVPEVIGAEAMPPMRSLDSKSFAGALQGQLAKKGVTMTLAERKLMKIVNGKDSPRRTRQLAHMERHVRAHLELSPTAAIDWSSIDWSKVLSTVLQLLIKLLPLLLAL